jgi:small-conductance mechanosensitive channel
VDNYLGTVEHIGLKTTRVRSLSGEQLVFSNNDLLKIRVRNYPSILRWFRRAASSTSSKTGDKIRNTCVFRAR